METESINFVEKEKIYNKYFSSGSTISNNLTDKLKLIHLICLVTFKMHEKDPSITARTVIEKIFKVNLEVCDYGMQSYLASLAIICQDMLYAIEKVDTLGYKSSKEIINEIKTLVEAWIPF